MIPEIDIGAASELLASGDAVFVDIRDARAFASAHISGAIQATPERMEALLAETPKDAAIVVVCYHGNSSRQATAWFHQQGFTGARSMSGGFESWRMAAANDDAYAIEPG